MLNRQRVIDWWLGRLTDAQLAEYAGIAPRALQFVLANACIKNKLVDAGRGSRRTRRVPPKVRNAIAMIVAGNDAGLSLDLAATIIGTFWYLPDTVNRAVDFDPIMSGVCPLAMHEPKGGYLVTDIIPQHIAWHNVLPCRDVRDENPSEGNVIYVPAAEWKPDPSTGGMHVERNNDLPSLDLLPLTPGPVYQGEIDPLGLWLPTNTRTEAMRWDDQLEIINGRWIFHRTAEPSGWDALQAILNGVKGATKNTEYRSKLLGEITEGRKTVTSFLTGGAGKSVASLRGADDEIIASAKRDYENFQSKLIINLSLPVRRMKRRALGLAVNGEMVRTSWDSMPVLPFPEPAPEPKSQAELDEEDFFRKWDIDAAGNRVLVGLTKEEYDEFETLDARSWKSRTDDSFPWASVEEMHKEKGRWLELHDKHEMARLRRLGEEFAKRQEAGE